MAAPSLASPAAMATTTVGSTLSISWEDGSKTDYTLAYKPFFTTGDLVADGKGGKILAGVMLILITSRLSINQTWSRTSVLL